MDFARFYASVRASVFGGHLSTAAFDGIEALLASCRRHNVRNPHHVANILAQVHHETGGYMLPIKETVYASHDDKNPSDATVIARLDRAWERGQLSWVKTPYWRDGWFGRGPIQLTHEANYRRMGDRLGVDLVENPSLALDPSVGADIAVVGMTDGMFTGKKLSDFRFPGDLASPVASNPRRIVNGQDGTDAKIAANHRRFFSALEAAGWGDPVIEAVPMPVPAPAPRPEPVEAPKQEKKMAEGKTGGPNSKANGATVGGVAGFGGSMTIGVAVTMIADMVGVLPPETDVLQLGGLITFILLPIGGTLGPRFGAWFAPKNAD